jgi:hypothetical protein
MYITYNHNVWVMRLFILSHKILVIFFETQFYYYYLLCIHPYVQYIVASGVKIVESLLIKF